MEVFYPPQNPEEAHVKAEALDYESWVVNAVATVGIGVIGLTALYYYLVK